MPPTPSTPSTPSRPLQRSEKASLELASRVRTLNIRERGALFLADGSKTFQELQYLLQDDGSMLQRLVDDGYLVAASAAQVPAAALLPAGPDPLPASQPPAPGSADHFGGKRSLATTRMFLFDICERMFARKAPDLALNFRDALREARDRESMLEIARDIVLKVEEVAGAERANGLSERIARLLPNEAVAA
ncbi:MAG: hypothetical protein EOO28_01080 [Comamonadaceae bacterium]|nr:MAG: hypothetical protein EOO28_01080 [Comamonadaceae bacterium]